MSNLKDITLFLLDMDGTVNLGYDPIDGAKEFLETLLKQGKNFIFLTNNSSKNANDYVEKMKNLGFPCEKENVFTSGMAAGMFLRDNKKDKKVYVCGTESLKNELKTLKNMLLQRNEGWRTGVLLRLLYFTVYPFYIDKKIWIFMDLPYRADDNAFQLFKYVVERNDSDIEKYFAISKHDYEVNDVEIMANKYRSSSKLFKIRRV